MLFSIFNNSALTVGQCGGRYSCAWTWRKCGGGGTASQS